MKKMRIPLENVVSNEVYLGSKSRPSSATSVTLLSSNTLACCHFNGQKIYIFRFDIDTGWYERVAQLDTTYQGIPCQTDLIASDSNGHIVTTNFFQHSCTMYHFDGQGLRMVKELPYRPKGPLHGVRFYSDEILAATSRREAAGIHFFNWKTDKVISIIGAPGKSVQDVFFISDSRAIMISTTDSPKMEAGKMWASIVDIIDFDIQHKKASLVYTHTFQNTHYDCVVVNDNKAYMTDQYNNKVVVLDLETLTLMHSHDDYSFPHGLDVKYGLLAVTNYGLNTVELRTLTA